MGESSPLPNPGKAIKGKFLWVGLEGQVALSCAMNLAWQ